MRSPTVSEGIETREILCDRCEKPIINSEDLRVIGNISIMRPLHAECYKKFVAENPKIGRRGRSILNGTKARLNLIIVISICGAGIAGLPFITGYFFAGLPLLIPMYIAYQTRYLVDQRYERWLK